jgi:hypothetical protein
VSGVSWFAHALRVHAQHPDGPLPHGGRPFPSSQIASLPAALRGEIGSSAADRYSDIGPPLIAPGGEVGTLSAFSDGEAGGDIESLSSAPGDEFPSLWADPGGDLSAADIFAGVRERAGSRRWRARSTVVCRTHRRTW